jgi:hypothetical protein
MKLCLRKWEAGCQISSAHFPYFLKINVWLRDHVNVCVSSPPPPSQTTPERLHRSTRNLVHTPCHPWQSQLRTSYIRLISNTNTPILQLLKLLP